MNRLIYILFLLVLFSCKREENKKSYSLAIITENSDDPYNPNIFNEYSSNMVCLIGFKKIQDSVIYYKPNENGRFIARILASKDSTINHKQLVNFIHSKKHKGHYNDSMPKFTSVYSGPLYVSSIQNQDSTSRKLIAESLRNKSFEKMIETLEYAAFSDSIQFFNSLNWISLGNNTFPDFVLSVEQYANIQFPLPTQVPLEIGK